MNTGIYSISHITSGKVYIGSAANFHSRWRIHKAFLCKGTHHSRHLQSAWDKDGENAFRFKKLVICAKEHLILYEQILIDGHRAAERKFGYNARPTAESMLGFKQPPEAIAKMRAANIGRKASPETRALLSSQRKGRKMPDWFPEFTRSHRTGSKHSEETKAYIGAIQVGRPVSIGTRERKAKITYEQVATIKAQLAAGSSQKNIAKEFSLSQSAVSLIASGKRWTNLPPTHQENPL